MLAGAGGEKLWRYWERELAGELPVLNLPLDKPRPPVQTYSGAAQIFTIDPALAARVRVLAAAQGTTLYATLLAVFSVLLQRWSQQDEIIVGSPMAGRSWSEFADLPGYFANP